MDNTSQRRAVRNYRSRLTERGLARFEVLGRISDRALIRSIARQLAEDGPDAARLRQAVSVAVGGDAGKGGILAALRRSPLVGSGIDLTKTRHPGRDIDL